MRNTAPYVKDAVLSVLGQAGSDVELVVVDDGSTDESRQIVESLHDPRIRTLAGPCRGIAAAWNLALAESQGEILLQCDSDDLYPPGSIAWRLDFLDAHPELGAVCGGFSSMDHRGRHLLDLFYSRFPGEEITTELLSGKARTSLCTFAIRRESLIQVGGKREFFESAEDIDLQLRLAEHCRVWYEPRCFYRYRLHHSSITHSQGSRRREFFGAYARELCAQRAAGRTDDLDLGHPASPPAQDSHTNSATAHTQESMLRKAWKAHDEGLPLVALGTALRAVALAPFCWKAWRTLAALIYKTVRPGVPSGSA